MKRDFFALFVIFLLIILTGCSQNNHVNYPDCGLEKENTNNYIKMIFEPTLNTFKNGSEVVITVYCVKKDATIISTRDFNSEIFLYDKKNNKWIEVENEEIYLDNFGFTINNQYRRIIFSVAPAIPDKGKINDLFICIKGQLSENGELSEKYVGATTTLKLRPWANLFSN